MNQIWSSASSARSWVSGGGGGVVEDDQSPVMIGGERHSQLASIALVLVCLRLEKRMAAGDDVVVTRSLPSAVGTQVFQESAGKMSAALPCGGRR